MIRDDPLDPGLAETAAEVTGVLSAWRLSTMRRRELYSRAVALSEQRSALAIWRRLSGERWLPAALGGAVLAAAAGAAIGVAVSRGRRQQHAVAA